MKWAFSLLVFALLAAPALKLLIRSRERAELQISLFLLLGAGLGLRIGAVAGEHVAVLPNALGHAALSLAAIPLFLFTRAVFRPSEPWARWFATAGIVGSFAALPLLAADGGFANETAL